MQPDPAGGPEGVPRNADQGVVLGTLGSSDGLTGHVCSTPRDASPRVRWGQPRSTGILARGRLIGLALTATAGALAATYAPAAQAEPFSISTFQVKTCAEDACQEPYTQASGHPTAVDLNIAFGAEGEFRHLRIDLPPGFAVDPQATPPCEVGPLEANLEVDCGESQVGSAEFVTSGLGLQRPGLYHVAAQPGADVPLEVAIATKGFAGGTAGLTRNVLVKGGVSWHTEPGVNVPTGDYHEYIEATAPIGVHVLRILAHLSTLAAGQPSLEQLPSECASSDGWHLQAQSWSYAENTDLPPGTASETTELADNAEPGVEGCLTAPFAPVLDVAPGSATVGGDSQYGAPDGIDVNVTVPQHTEASEIGTADARQVSVDLPEGLTINPAAATTVQACSAEEFGINEGSPGTALPVIEGTEDGPTPVTCPGGSLIGSFEARSPDLAEPLSGAAYLAVPLGEDPASGQEYRIFLQASAPEVGIETRLVGDISADPTTGRLTATVLTPQLPVSGATIQLTGDANGLLANPIACGPAESAGALYPYGQRDAVNASSLFAVTGCPSPPKFNPAQSTGTSYPQAGASGPFQLSLTREDGQPYLSGLATTLPEGLLGDLASVVQPCQEAQANAGACPQDSQIGTVRTTVGAGPEPLTVPATDEAPGGIYLTGPYDGAPYGLAIVVPAQHIGPYAHLGTAVTLATISIDPYTARVTVAAVRSFAIVDSAATASSTPLPTVVGGVPIRLRSLSINLQRPDFIVNPTRCQELTTETSLQGINAALGPVVASAVLTTPFEVTGCHALGFSPVLRASTAAQTARATGAGLSVTLNPPAGQDNVRALTLTLPPQLVARLAQLQRACTAAQFSSGPVNCPASSQVATATLRTPLLPGVLTGAGYLVSRGGAFPDLDFVLEGDGVKLVEVGNTAIKGALTSVSFTALPDAPFTTFTSVFASGPHALLAANSSLCSRSVTQRTLQLAREHGRLVTVAHTDRRQVPLRPSLPVTFTSQDGVIVTRRVTMTVVGCPKHPRPVHITTAQHRSKQATRSDLRAP